MRLELTRVGLLVELANHYITKVALLNMRVTATPIVIGVLSTVTKYSIIKVGQNTEESPRDLRRLAVTQTQRGCEKLVNCNI